MENWQGTETIIISGAPQQTPSFVLNFLSQHEQAKIVCVDGGIKQIAGRMPDLIVGDFDSYTFCDFPCEVIRLIPEKDDTDTMHALQVVTERGCKKVWILCATGGRLDHMLSNFSLCEYAWERGCDCHIVDTQNELFFAGNRPITLKKSNAYRYFSIIPLDVQLKGVSIQGAKYPLENATVNRSQMYTISNEIAQEQAKIYIQQGRALVILSHD